MVMTQLEFRDKLIKRYGHRYSPLNFYTGYSCRMKFRCNICGTIFIKTWRNMKRQRDNYNCKCPYCEQQLRLKSKLKNLHETDVVPITHFYDYKTKITWECLICGCTFRKDFGHFKRLDKYGMRCPLCEKRMKHYLSRIDFARKVYWDTGKQYINLTPFVGRHHKVYMEHLKCGYKWWIEAGSFLYGTRCPKCMGELYPSRYELLMKKWFIRRNIPFTHSYVIKSGNHKFNNLHLDFIFKKYNVAIEFDGRQHRQPIKHYGGMKQFKKQVCHDFWKTEWCNYHHIKLYRMYVSRGTSLDSKRKQLYQELNKFRKEVNLDD